MNQLPVIFCASNYSYFSWRWIVLTSKIVNICHLTRYIQFQELINRFIAKSSTVFCNAVCKVQYEPRKKYLILDCNNWRILVMLLEMERWMKWLGRRKKNMDSGLLALLRATETTYPNIFPSPLSQAVQCFISRLFLFFISFTPSSTLLQVLN